MRSGRNADTRCVPSSTRPASGAATNAVKDSRSAARLRQKACRRQTRDHAKRRTGMEAIGDQAMEQQEAERDSGRSA
ncbi:hypothetical protein K449DRAFT_212561 [Hypoxylon sp. EC38]|nr:hypothetical protein K449DRAFT_212561 [Hypoxylon sp. EC38]